MPQPDPHDFESLLAEILPGALKTATYLCRDADDAQDLVQNAAIQAYRQFDKFERGTNFKAWFLKVQHNCFLGRLRHDARRPQTVQVEDEETVDSLYLFEQTRGGKAFGGDPARSFVAAPPSPRPQMTRWPRRPKSFRLRCPRLRRPQRRPKCRARWPNPSW